MTSRPQIRAHAARVEICSVSIAPCAPCRCCAKGSRDWDSRRRRAVSSSLAPVTARSCCGFYARYIRRGPAPKLPCSIGMISSPPARARLTVGSGAPSGRLQADALEWAQTPGEEQYELGVATLFLHHLDGDQLPRLLASLALRTDAFVACEPRRGCARTARQPAGRPARRKRRDAGRCSQERGGGIYRPGAQHRLAGYLLQTGASTSVLRGLSRTISPPPARVPTPPGPAMPRDADVLVIGAGPAGSAISILLGARRVACDHGGTA